MQALFLPENQKSDVSYVIPLKHARRVLAGRGKHVVDLELIVARAGRHDGGAGRVNDTPRGGGDQAARPPRNHDNVVTGARRRVKPLRGKNYPVDCGDSVVGPDVEVSPRRRESGSVAPVVTADGEARPDDETTAKGGW